MQLWERGFAEGQGMGMGGVYTSSRESSNRKKIWDHADGILAERLELLETDSRSMKCVPADVYLYQ